MKCNTARTKKDDCIIKYCKVGYRNTLLAFKKKDGCLNMYYQATKKDQLFFDEQRYNSLALETPSELKVDYKIINVVAMGVLSLVEDSIDLAKIEAIIPVKHPNYFPCVMFKVENVSILVFKNGKII